MIPTSPDERDVLAGEYVLGLLDAGLAAEVERAAQDDADLARRITFWEQRLAPATASVAPLPGDAGLWNRIAGSLHRGAGGPLAAVPALPRRTRRVRDAWGSVRLWRAVAAVATAAALALAILPPRPPPESATRFFALLQGRDASGAETGPGWLIQVARDGTVRSLPLTEVEPGSGQALQLWTLWDQARGPVSLGVLPPGGAVRLSPERLDVIASGQLFEITLEPAAGSPTGRPTGRILFIGRARAPAPQPL